MFIVACDLSESQRERLTSSLSLKGMNVTAYTVEAVKTVFVELFCTPKSSMENPKLRANRHGGSTNRTFIVDNYAEDEFGQWAIDDEYTWQSRPSKGRQVRKRKGKGKGKGKGGLKGTRRAFLGEEQAQDPEQRSEEDCAWWSRGKRDKKCFSER